MEHLLKLRLADFTAKPIKMGLHSPQDKNIVLKALIFSNNVRWTEKEVKELEHS